MEVVFGGPRRIVVRLSDGTSMRVPRSWTDADGPTAAEEPGSIFTIEAIRELVDLVQAFACRA
jgi:hypothetical protein